MRPFTFPGPWIGSMHYMTKGNQRLQDLRHWLRTVTWALGPGHLLHVGSLTSDPQLFGFFWTPASEGKAVPNGSLAGSLDDVDWLW